MMARANKPETGCSLCRARDKAKRETEDPDTGEVVAFPVKWRGETGSKERASIVE